MRQKSDVFPPFWNNVYYKGSFSCRGGILWNSLPTDIKTSESKAIFKRKLANRQANCWLVFIIGTYFLVSLQYLLLFQYGFHVKKFFLVNLWNYRIQIKVNQSINQSICLSVCLSLSFFPEYCSMKIKPNAILSDKWFRGRELYLFYWNQVNSLHC